jgi:ATP-dependent Clp protease ATP-binding subunit ClpA
MFERFTDRARSSVVLAQVQARRLKHGYIGTEHLLLGLLAESDGLAARILGEVGVRITDVEADIEQIIGRGEEETPAGHIPFTPRAKKVLELSLREALQLGHNYIGTEHILLGIVREGEGVAAQVLAKHRGLTLEEARKRVVAELRADRPTPRQPARTPAAEEVLQVAQGLAGDTPVGSHHLLGALARAEGSMAANALAALGVDPDMVAAKLGELRLEDTTDVTPEQAAARQMELRVDGDEVHVILRDAATMEGCTRVLDLAGGSMNGADARARGFPAVWREMQQALARTEAALSADQPNDKDVVKRSRRRRRKPPA